MIPQYPQTLIDVDGMHKVKRESRDHMNHKVRLAGLPCVRELNKDLATLTYLSEE
jgi:hypothetical protein